MPVSLKDIQDAHVRIADGVVRTPCLEAIPLSELTGAQIFCKLDNQQRTGSFKERGARNALLQLTPEQRRRGVVAASAGNHASALAYHGKLLGIPVTVAMPASAPLIKVSTCERLGATVLVEGEDFSAARKRADQLVESEGLTYINGYDDPAIIAGQGTMGIEILEQVPDVEAIIVPIGGAGLIAGIATAVKALRPEVRIIGVESNHTASYAAALRSGHPVTVRSKATLADGLAVLQVGENAFYV
ncbi:MAG: threonine/serine dehydratase, partial [Verrucomicrobiaceae bacterium]